MMDMLCGSFAGVVTSSRSAIVHPSSLRIGHCPDQSQPSIQFRISVAVLRNFAASIHRKANVVGS